jgi:hypothetical protein
MYLRLERYLYDSINPVVGFRPISEFCQDGEIMEPEVSVPTAAGIISSYSTAS